ncbi:MAG TPA: hypothetical protein PKZ20_10435 [Rhodocyclaceae bacterium]|nr:hypothetical protein [Rhodocyclaceae bacterium]HNF62136.1 hypothetical protein [Rhodocyclaceae bacterium]
MNKYQLLQQRAEEFHKILTEYAQTDPDVADFLKHWLPWHQKILQNKIRLPCYDYQLFVYFSNPDLSPIAERYGFANAPNRLLRAASNFSTAMNDSLSDPTYLAQLREAGELPDLVPNEHPTPDEGDSRFTTASTTTSLPQKN